MIKLLRLKALSLNSGQSSLTLLVSKPETETSPSATNTTKEYPISDSEFRCIACGVISNYAPDIIPAERLDRNRYSFKKLWSKHKFSWDPSLSPIPLDDRGIHDIWAGLWPDINFNSNEYYTSRPRTASYLFQDTESSLRIPGIDQLVTRFAYKTAEREIYLRRDETASMQLPQR